MLPSLRLGRCVAHLGVDADSVGCSQMEEVAGPRPQTAQLQSHLRFVAAKLAPLVNANETAELRVRCTPLS